MRNVMKSFECTRILNDVKRCIKAFFVRDTGIELVFNLKTDLFGGTRGKKIDKR